LQAAPGGTIGLRQDQRNFVARSDEPRQGSLGELRGARED
jgi:hypothetical protein